MFAVGYCRVSTDNQAETGHSLDAQQRAIEEYCARKGWQLQKIYTDAGISGTLDTRPALETLFRDAEREQFNVVVVDAICRDCRSLSGLLRAMDKLDRQHVSFVSITENLDFTTSWGKLTLAVLGTLAEIYIDKLRIETRKGLLERAKKGLHNGTIPFGYCTGLCSACNDPNGKNYCPRFGKADLGTGKVPVPHPIEAIAVRRAFKQSVLDRVSDRDIAAHLNKVGVRYNGKTIHLRPKRKAADLRRYGPPVFLKDSVREMLKRVFYTGVVPYYGITATGKKRKRNDAAALYPGQHRAIIPQTLFERAQEARRIRRTAPITRAGKPVTIHPLTGTLICGNCSKPMISVSTNGRRYYRCATRIQQRDACTQPTVRTTVAEAQLVDFFRQLQWPAHWPDRLIPDILASPAQRETYQSLQEKMVRAKKLFIEGDLSRAEYERHRRHYREQVILNLTTIQPDAILASYYLAKNLPTLWDTAKENTLKRKLPLALLEAITIQGHTLTAIQANSVFYPLLKHTCLFRQEGQCHSGSDGNTFESKSYLNGVLILPPTYSQDLPPDELLLL